MGRVLRDHDHHAEYLPGRGGVATYEGPQTNLISVGGTPISQGMKVAGGVVTNIDPEKGFEVQTSDGKSVWISSNFNPRLLPYLNGGNLDLNAAVKAGIDSVQDYGGLGVTEQMIKAIKAGEIYRDVLNPNNQQSNLIIVNDNPQQNKPFVDQRRQPRDTTTKPTVKTETITEKVDNSAQISNIEQAIEQTNEQKEIAKADVSAKQVSINDLQNAMQTMTREIADRRKNGQDTSKQQKALDSLVENFNKLNSELKASQDAVARADDTIKGYNDQIDKLSNQTRTVTRTVSTTKYEPNKDTGTYYGDAQGYDTAGDSRFGLFDKPTTHSVTSGDKVELATIKPSDESDLRVLDPRYVQFEIPSVYSDLYGQDQAFTKLVDDTQKKINDYNDLEEKVAQLRIIMSNTNSFIEPRFVDRSNNTVVFTDKDGVIGVKGKEWTTAELSDLFYTDYTKATREAKQDIGKSLDSINSYRKTLTKELKTTQDALKSKSAELSAEIGQLLKSNKNMSTKEIKDLQNQKEMIDSQWRDVRSLKSTLTTGKLNTEDGVKAADAITKANDTIALSKYYKNDGQFDIIQAVQDGASIKSLQNIGFSTDSVNKVNDFLNNYTQVDGEWYTKDDAQALNDFRDNTYLLRENGEDKYFAKSDIEGIINQYPEQARETVRSIIFDKGIDEYKVWAKNIAEDYAWAKSGYSKKDTNTLQNKYITADGNIDLDKLYTSGKQDLLNKVQLLNDDGSEMSKAEKADLFTVYDDTEKYIKNLKIDDKSKDDALEALKKGGLDGYNKWVKDFNAKIDEQAQEAADSAKENSTLKDIWKDGNLSDVFNNVSDTVEWAATGLQKIVDDALSGSEKTKTEKTKKNKDNVANPTELVAPETETKQKKDDTYYDTTHGRLGGLGEFGEIIRKDNPYGSTGVEDSKYYKAGEWFAEQANKAAEFEEYMADKNIITEWSENPYLLLIPGYKGFSLLAHEINGLTNFINKDKEPKAKVEYDKSIGVANPTELPAVEGVEELDTDTAQIGLVGGLDGLTKDIKPTSKESKSLKDNPIIQNSESQIGLIGGAGNLGSYNIKTPKDKEPKEKVKNDKSIEVADPTELPAVEGIEEKKYTDTAQIGLVGGLDGLTKDIKPTSKDVQEASDSLNTLAYYVNREVGVNNIHDLGIIANSAMASIFKTLAGDKTAPGELVNLGVNLAGYIFTLPKKVIETPEQGIAEVMSVIVPSPELPKIVSKVKNALSKTDDTKAPPSDGGTPTPAIVENKKALDESNRVDVAATGKVSDNIQNIQNKMPATEFTYSYSTFSDSLRNGLAKGAKEIQTKMVDDNTLKTYNKQTLELQELADSIKPLETVATGDLTTFNKANLETAAVARDFDARISDIIDANVNPLSPVNEIGETGKYEIRSGTAKEVGEIADGILQRAKSMIIPKEEQMEAISFNDPRVNESMKQELARETSIIKDYADFLDEVGMKDEAENLNLKVEAINDALNDSILETPDIDGKPISGENIMDGYYDRIDEHNAKTNAFYTQVERIENTINGDMSANDRVWVVKEITKIINRIKEEINNKEYLSPLDIHRLRNEITTANMLIDDLAIRDTINLGIKGSEYFDFWQGVAKNALEEAKGNEIFTLDSSKGGFDIDIDVKSLANGKLKEVENNNAKNPDATRITNELLTSGEKTFGDGISLFDSADAFSKYIEKSTRENQPGPKKTQDVGSTNDVSDYGRKQEEKSTIELVSEKGLDQSVIDTIEEIMKKAGVKKIKDKSKKLSEKDKKKKKKDDIEDKEEKSSKGTPKEDNGSNVKTATKAETELSPEIKKAIEEILIKDDEKQKALEIDKARKEQMIRQKILRDMLRKETERLRKERAEREGKSVSDIKKEEKAKALSEEINKLTDDLNEIDYKKKGDSEKANKLTIKIEKLMKELVKLSPKTTTETKQTTKTGTKIETATKTEIGSKTSYSPDYDTRIDERQKILTKVGVQPKLGTDTYIKIDERIEPIDETDPIYRYQPKEQPEPYAPNVPKPPKTPTRTDDPGKPKDPDEPKTPRKPGKSKKSNDMSIPKNNPTGQIAWRQGSLKINGKIRPVWIVLDFKNGQPVKKYVFQTPKGAKILKRTPKETVYTTGKNVKKTTVDVGNMTVSVDPSSSQVLKFSKKMPNNKAINKMSRGM